MRLYKNNFFLFQKRKKKMSSNCNQNSPQKYTNLAINGATSVNTPPNKQLVTLETLSQNISQNIQLQNNNVINNCNIDQNNEKLIFPVTCAVENIPDYTSINPIQPNNQTLFGYDVTMSASTSGIFTMNGVALESLDYVFLNRQTDKQRNGIYQYLKIGDSQNVIACGASPNLRVVVPPGTTILGPNPAVGNPPNNQGFFPNGNGCYPDINGQYPNGAGLYPSSTPTNNAIFPVLIFISILNQVWYYPIIIGGNIFYPNGLGFYPNQSLQYVVTYPSQFASDFGSSSIHFLRDTQDDYRHPSIVIVPIRGEALFNNEITDVGFTWKIDLNDVNYTYRKDTYGKYLTIPLRNSDISESEQFFAGFNQYEFTNTSTNNNNIRIETRDNCSWKVGQCKIIYNNTRNTLDFDFDQSRSFDISIQARFIQNQSENFTLSTSNQSATLRILRGGRIVLRRTAFEKIIELVACTRNSRFFHNSTNYIFQ